MAGRGVTVFSFPFRLFFLAAGLYGAAAMVVWLCLYGGGLSWPGPVSPAIWHGHEMVFGYTMAVVAGFVLTAVTNWTGSAPWRGRPLALLGLVWLVGRLGFTAAPWLSPATVAVLDLPFIPALAYMLAVPVLESGNRRQLVFLAIMAALTAANLLVHLEALGVLANGGHVGLLLAVNVIMILIAVMGGRVIPAFTGNALRQRGDPTPPKLWPWLERLAVPSLALVAVLDLCAESSGVAGAAALVAAVLHGIRLSGWRGSRTLSQPILWVLHLGYGWLVLGLALKGLAVWMTPIPPSAALHALTAGAIGTLTIGIMSRVVLGHTGRSLVVGRLTVMAYGLVAAAALVRLAGPVHVPELTEPAMMLAGGLWVAAFALFLVGHAGMLLRPRADGRPG